jgi:hypothetical protein
LGSCTLVSSPVDGAPQCPTNQPGPAAPVDARSSRKVRDGAFRCADGNGPRRCPRPRPRSGNSVAPARGQSDREIPTESEGRRPNAGVRLRGGRHSAPEVQVRHFQDRTSCPVSVALVVRDVRCAATSPCGKQRRLWSIRERITAESGGARKSAPADDRVKTRGGWAGGRRRPAGVGAPAFLVPIGGSGGRRSPSQRALG